MKAIFDRIVLIVMAIALFLVGVAGVDFILHPLATDFTYHSTLYRALVILVLTPLTLLVGFLIIRRVPGNVVGPLLILWSGTVAYGSLRAGIGPWLFSAFGLYEIAIGWSALCLMLLHFPDGTIYPRRAAPWLYGLFAIFFPLGTLVNLSNPSNYGRPNPFSIPALHSYSDLFNAVLILLGSIALVMVPVSLVMRYRKGSFRERQQIKWLALLGTFLTAGTILGFIVMPLLTGGEMFSREDNLFSLLFFFAMSLFPALAIGIAVLRHHLWDIDILIRRTLVYSILTVIVTLIYFGIVVVLQSLFTTIIGHQSAVAIVLSTLAIAAIFSRLRRRIQTFIDRRFYRQKYNAERVLADFSIILREKVELDELTKSILGVMVETMQPEHVSIWLHKGDLHKGRENFGSF